MIHAINIFWHIGDVIWLVILAIAALLVLYAHAHDWITGVIARWRNKP